MDILRELQPEILAALALVVAYVVLTWVVRSFGSSRDTYYQARNVIAGIAFLLILVSAGAKIISSETPRATIDRSVVDERVIQPQQD